MLAGILSRALASSSRSHPTHIKAWLGGPGVRLNFGKFSGELFCRFLEKEQGERMQPSEADEAFLTLPSLMGPRQGHC